MTRFLLTLLLAATFCIRTQAQTDFKFSGGFFAGVTGTQVDGDKFAGFNKGGFTFGATAQYPLSPKFLAAIELDFTQKGAQSKNLVGNGGAYPNIYNLRVQYAEIPLMLKFYDRKTFGLGVGVEYSRLVGNAKQFIDPLTQSVYHVRGVDEGFTDYDVSGLAEASYYFTPKLQLNLRYAYGWTPMGHSSESDYKNYACFNNVIMVRLGYIFNQKFDEKKVKDKTKKPHKPYLEDAP